MREEREREVTLCSPLSQLMMIDCRVMGHSGMSGDSSALHHRLSMITKGVRIVLPVAALSGSSLLLDGCISLKASLYGRVREDKECVRC